MLHTCETIVAAMPQRPPIRHDNVQDAFYSSSEDYVNIPPLKYFQSSEFFYSVLFHELSHSTGHSSRLDRPGEDKQFIIEAAAKAHKAADFILGQDQPS